MKIIEIVHWDNVKNECLKQRTVFSSGLVQAWCKLSPQQQKEEEELDKRKSIVDEYLEFDDTMTNKSRYEDSGPSTQDSTSDTFNYIIRCNQLNPSELLKIKDVPVYVTKFEKKEGGIFEQSYVSYFINTPTLKKTVERRYSDF